MKIGPYSPCPGGLNKKIKFCCSDLLGQWPKIERMLEGEQYSACLHHVEQLDAQHPGRACLMATRAMLLRNEGRLDEAERVVSAFLEKHPGNPVALAESAIVTALTGEPVTALGALEQAIAAASDEMDHRVYAAMGLLADTLGAAGHPLAARALAMAQLSLDHEDRRPLEFLLEYNGAPSIPLILKEEWFLDSAPDGAAWKADFDAVRELAGQMRVLAAAAKLKDLAERHPDVPALWRTLGVLRALTADPAGAVEALRRFASLEVPLDDAVAAESLSLCLTEDPLGDAIDGFVLEYTVQNVEEVQTALLSSARVSQLPVAPDASDDGEPPPKGIYDLLDRAVPLTHAGLTADTVPRVLCHALLFGRQTDREARLLVRGVWACDLAQVKEFLSEVTEKRLAAPDKEQAVEKNSAMRGALYRNWRLPDDTTGEHYQQLSEEHWEKTLLERFPQQAFPYLDGKSPQEAAGQPACRARVLAALSLLEHWMRRARVRFDADRIRQRLGLPAPEPIELDGKPLAGLPLTRLARVVVEKLTDEALTAGLRRAMACAAHEAVRKFAREAVARPSLAGREEQLQALMVLARTEDNWEQAYKYLEQGRQAAMAAHRSCAPWDLLELPARLQRGEGEQAVQLIRHVQGQHGKEPGVGEALVNLLLRLGVLRPDGTMAVPVARQQEPSIVTPGQEGQEPGKLWTPDGQKPAGDKPTLWTPDMG